MRPVYYSKRQRAKRERRTRPFVEFSKRALTAMIVLWFLGAVYGALVVAVELAAMFRSFDNYGNMVTVHLPELLLYIGAPLSGGVVGYMIKSATENREKIKGGRPQEDRSI